jgi:alkylation response protein AidB-like acyl-CoA dehydrogenase
MLVAALPRSAFEIIDTWDASGLRGTGSCDVVVADAFVPVQRLFNFMTVRQPCGVTGRLPVMASISAMFAAQALGVAKSALAHLVERGRTDVTEAPTPDLRDRPEAQTGVAAHAAALAAARLLLHERAAAAWRHAVDGEPPAQADITDLFGAAMHAIATSARAMSAMHALGGTRALFPSSPLERAKRDMDAIVQHIVAQPTMRSDVGRAMFGLEPAFPLYWL